MTAKNPQKQVRILEGGGAFFWLARIYTPALEEKKGLLLFNATISWQYEAV